MLRQKYMFYCGRYKKFKKLSKIVFVKNIYLIRPSDMSKEKRGQPIAILKPQRHKVDLTMCAKIVKW